MLRTIGNNIANTANNVGTLTYQVQGTAKNIQLIDESTGDLKSTFQVLSEIAEDWDKMSTAEQQAVGIALAGKNQFEVFAATVGNFNQAISASETALNSQGSAARENAKYMESLEAAVANLKAEWQALANNLISSDFIKFFINAGAAILKFANSDVGQAIIKITALAGVIRLAIGAFYSIQWAIAGSATAMAVLNTAFTALTNPILLVTALLGGIVFALFKVGQAQNEAFNFEQWEKKIEKTTQKIEENKNKLQELQSEYDNLANKDVDDLTDAEKVRLTVLEHQLENLKQQTEELEKQRKHQAEKAYEQFQKEDHKLIVGKEIVQGVGLGTELQDVTADANEYIKTLNSWNDATKEAQDSMDAYAQKLVEIKENVGELTQTDQEWLDIYYALTEAQQTNTDTLINNAKNISQTNLSILTNLDNISDLITAYQKLTQGIALTDAEYEDLITKYPQLIKYSSGAKNAHYIEADALYDVAVSAGNMSKAEIQAQIDATNATLDGVRQRIKAMIDEAKAMMTLSKGYTKLNEVTGVWSEQQYQAYVQLTKTQWELEDQLASLQIAYNWAGSSANSASNKTSKLDDKTKELTNTLKDEANALKEAADLMVSKINLEIEALQKQKDEIQDVNDAIEDQIELEEALKALAEAKSKRVLIYKDGQFQYGTDVAAVSEAQQKVNEIQRKQAQQAALDEIDAQIDALKAEQETWKNVSKAYDDYLGKQALGIDQEAENWKDRLGQAQAFADEYLKIMQTIAAVEAGTMSATEAQSILAQAKSFGTTLPKSNSPLINPMQSSSVPTFGTSSSFWNRFMPNSASNGNTVIQQFGNIVLPNVTNASQFVEELSNYSQFAIQSATER